MSIDQQIQTLKDKLETVKGTPCSIFTRIVGYYRVVKNWNKGKRKEYDDRLPYKIPKNK